MKRIEMLNRIQEIYTKLESETLQASEVEELVDLSNRLYERALILRYKIAEQRIFGEKESISENDDANNTDALSEVSNNSTDLPDTIDFSLFEKAVDIEIEEIKVEETEETVSLFFAEEPQMDQLNFHDTTEEATIFEKVEDKPEEIISETKEEEIGVPNPISAKTEWTAHFDKILIDHSSGIHKSISAISGSFGLNERILFINELFNGNAEKFSNAVLQLDKIEDWNSCKTVLSEFANSESWDMESDTIVEFVLHVNRKHA
jgi:hypothetical protein